MQRAIWKGAISFGLVHVPVALYPASQETGIDFDWLDSRSMDPVGYKRVNKRTGKEITREHIVKGIKQDDGDYVVLTDEQIKAAYPKATQTIEIESFVKAGEIAFVLLERPYFLEPTGKGEKVYALLREAMLEAGVIGIARVVMHTKEHLAALIASGPALMLNTIRWASEMRSPDALKLPPAGKSAAKLNASELKMAAQLIGDMTAPWKPEAHADSFSAAVRALVNKKLEAGDTEKVTALDDSAPETSGSNVVDLTELLARSLAKRKLGATPSAAAPAKKPAAKRPARKRA
ncbi:MAG: Ku protein [Burkholderiales bacterium]|nr:Ku protein [Burkholderiales bacterium]